VPNQAVLIMAVTRMLSGVCLAGFTTQPHPQSGLCWVRPVKAHDTLQLGDITDERGRVLQCFDVAELALLRPRPQPPHAEDWITEFIRHRPQAMRRLTDPRRGVFLATHLDRSPEDVLCHHTRSLCLVRPTTLWARFTRDPQPGAYSSRVGFALEGPNPTDTVARGVAVTDIRFRALGRRLLADAREVTLDHDALLAATGAREVYLALGLSRSYEGRLWPLVLGVHTVPDYEVTLDYTAL